MLSLFVSCLSFLAFRFLPFHAAFVFPHAYLVTKTRDRRYTLSYPSISSPFIILYFFIDFFFYKTKLKKIQSNFPGPPHTASLFPRGRQAPGHISPHKATTTSKLGTSRPRYPVLVFSIFRTTSMPSTTLPKTTCLLSRKGVGTVVMKNWEPLPLGPAFWGC